MTGKYDRLKDAPWFSGNSSIYCLVGGAGGISSWLSLFLTRAGFNPIVYDFDSVEEHNLGGQLYSFKHIGKLKVDALREIIGDFTDEYIEVFDERYDSKSLAHHIVFSGFDKMSSRKEMFNVWKNHIKTIDEDSLNQSIFIDGRLLAEQMQIFCIPGKNKEAITAYEEEYLFDDSEVPDMPCTFRQTSHSAAMIAAFMTGFFTNHIAGEGRIVPFYTEYFIPLNLLNQIECG